MRPLAAIWCVFAALTLLWLRMNHTPPDWDDAWYLTNSLVMYDALTERGVAGFAKQFIAILGFKAPLVTALPTPVYLLLGRHWRAAYLVNLAVMALLFGAVWAIAKRLWNPRAALIAVYVTATMPLLFGLSRWYLVEYPLAAAVAAAMWLLLVSDNLEDKRATLLFGVVSGLGLLLKVSYPLFVLLPAIYALYRSKRRLRALLLAGIPCLILALPWYAFHWEPTIANAFSAGFGAPALTISKGPVFSFSTMAAYLSVLVRHGLSAYYAIALALALLIVVRQRPGMLRALAPLLLWAAPFLIFLFGVNKDVRYIAPILPAFALALGCLLDAAAHKRPWLLAPVLAFPLVSLVAISFGWPYQTHELGYVRRWRVSDWRQDEILRAIRNITAFRPGEKKLVVIGTDRGAFNVNNFELFALQQRLPLVFETTAYENDPRKALLAAGNAAFFVYKDGGEPESPFFNHHIVEIVRYVRHSPHMLELPYARALPDGGVARLFQNIGNGTFVPAGGRPLQDSNVQFGGMITLTGLAVTQRPEELEVRYRWRCERPVDRDYWCFTQIADSRGKIIGFLDHRVLEGSPAIDTWSPGDLAYEDRSFPVPAALANDRLRVRIGLYHRPSGERLRIAVPFQGEGSLADDGTALVVESR